MFFALSKILAFAAAPSSVLVLASLVGIALLTTRFRRTGLRMLVAAVLLLAICGVLPVGHALASILESRFPNFTGTDVAPAGIVVLGGAIDPEASVEEGRPVLNPAYQRLAIVPQLARQFPGARVIYSGGNGGLFPSDLREADYAGPLLTKLGVAPERIVLERESRNTAENAAMTAALLKPKPGERWLLVTSAEHMPRAVGCFRQAGFDVVAVPVGGSSTPFSLSASFGAGLARLDRAAHEWFGLLAYRLTGRTGALLPGP